MHTSGFILGLLIFLFSLPAAAQEAQPSYRASPTVTDISAVLLAGEADADPAWQLTVTGFQNDACAFDVRNEQAAYPHNIDIQLYREIPLSAACPREATPFQISFMLAADAPAPYLTVNSQVWEIIWPAGDSLRPGDKLGFQETSLLEVLIDEAAIQMAAVADEASRRYELTVQGSHAVGCDLPVLYSRRQTAASVLIGAFNPVAEGAVCPAMLLPLDETIAFSATDLPADALFGVNAYIINEGETQTMSDSIKVMTHINRVTAHVTESFPMRIRLDVVGEHPDGCEYPVKIAQFRQGNIIKIEVYRQVPADVICPMILQSYQSEIQLDGAFESGRYIIKVNALSQTIDI